MGEVIVTNNIKVKEACNGKYEIIFIDGGYEDVLYKVRDMIHKGAVLLTHPLSGSVKPGETPFKSVLLSDVEGKLDVDSLMTIEKSISTCEKLINQGPFLRHYNYTKRVLDDFRIVDLSLISNALNL